MSHIRNTAIIEAIQKACHSYGVKKIAAELDKQPSTLYGELNPWGGEKAKLGLDDAIEIIRITGDATVLSLIAAELGYRLVSKNPHPDKTTVPEECCQDMEAYGKFVSVCNNPSSTEKEIRMARHEVAREIDETEDLAIEERRARLQ